MTPTALLDRVTSTVSYLRIVARTDADAELEWLRCGELVARPDHLLQIVSTTAAGRGAAGRDDIAMSLFAQAYAFRIASTAIGGWLLSDRTSTFDVRPANTSIALGRHRPNAVALDRVALAGTDLWTVLFDDHLGPFVDSAHQALAASLSDQRIGRNLLWSNMAAGCASAFGAFHGAAPDGPGRAEVRAAADELYSTAPPEVLSGGQWVLYHGRAEEPGWFFQRNACCLLYQLPGPGDGAAPAKCEDCSLWSSEERTARYQAGTATGGAS